MENKSIQEAEIATSEIIVPQLSAEEIQEIEKNNEKFIDSQLATIGASDKLISELRENYRGLQVTNLADKAGYKAVREARLHVKDVRIAVQKRTTQILEMPKKFTDRVKKHSAELISGLKGIEEQLATEEEKVEIWKKEERERLEKEEMERIDNRCKLLDEAGIAITGQVYIVGDMSLHMNDVADFKDDEFNRWLEDAKVLNDQIKLEKAKAEALQLRKNELAKRGFGMDEDGKFYHDGKFQFTLDLISQMNADAFQQLLDTEDANIKSKADAKRKEEEEAAAIKAEQEKKQREQEAEAERLRQEQEKIVNDKRSLRIQTLASIHPEILPNSEGVIIFPFMLAPVPVDSWTTSDIHLISDEHWSHAIEMVKDKAAQYEHDRKVKAIRDKCSDWLIKKGFDFDGKTFAIAYIDESGGKKELSITDSQLFNLENEDAARELLDEAQTFVQTMKHSLAIIEEREQKRKQREQQEAEERRREELRPDKEAILAFAQTVSELKVPVMKTESGKRIQAGLIASVKDWSDAVIKIAESI